MKRNIICGCQVASAITCSLCDFAVEQKPMAAFRAPWANKMDNRQLVQFPEDSTGLDMLAMELIGPAPVGLLNQSQEESE
jgi:hypothetical protein